MGGGDWKKFSHARARGARRILCARVGDSFQDHVFGNPGMKRISECNGCMCLNHRFFLVLERFHVFHLFMNLVSRGKVLGVILEYVGGLGETFSHLLGSWGEA